MLNSKVLFIISVVMLLIVLGANDASANLILNLKDINRTDTFTADEGTDTDVDGIPDSTDSCPTDPETVNGYDDLDGCPDPDTDPPETIILSGPLEESKSDVATFGFSSDENNVSFRCSLDGSSIFSACSSPHEISNLGNGVHTLYIKAVDASNNEDPSPITYSWKIDIPNEESSTPEDNSNGITPVNDITQIIIVVAFAGGIGAIIMFVKQRKKKSGKKDINLDYTFDDSKLK
jgi:hypothetical protein